VLWVTTDYLLCMDEKDSEREPTNLALAGA
jgi:hypothetical protein